MRNLHLKLRVRCKDLVLCAALLRIVAFSLLLGLITAKEENGRDIDSALSYGFPIDLVISARARTSSTLQFIPPRRSSSS